MNMIEYEKVKDMTYLEYCDYLQNKYGLTPRAYCSENWIKYNENTGTKYGLVIHHKMEDHAQLLSTHGRMEKYPYEWQSRENLVYCDFLEHLLLHILITKYPAPDRIDKNVGSGGIGLIYEDILSFFQLSTGIVINISKNGHFCNNKMEKWQKTCFDAIKGDFDVFIALCESISPERDLKKTFFIHVKTLSHSDKFNSIISTYRSEHLPRNKMKHDNELTRIKYKNSEKKNDYCTCNSNHGVTTGFEDDWGYWYVCCSCGKKIEDGHHYYNHYDGEDHDDEIW